MGPGETGEAKCAKTEKILFTTDSGDEELESPYACTATDPNKRCKIVFDLGETAGVKDTPKESYVDVLCKCSLKDASSGYCESVIGTEIYEKAMRAKKLLYKTSNCHTLDRDSMRA